MNKIITAAGLVALGAASLQPASAQGMGSTQTTKPWSVSATLRGFYDDNYTTSPKAVRRDSFGFEVAPSIGLNIFRDQTTIGLSYLYSMRYYEDRNEDTADHSHQFNGKLSHAFTPRFKFDISDSFVIAQEPAIIDPQLLTTFLRSDGDNVRNSVNANLSIGLTERLDTVIGYENAYYDYDQEGAGSRSALLDRVEHFGKIDLRAELVPTTIGVLGYRFGLTDYNSDDPLNPVGAPISPDVRDATSHYGYVGVDQTINPQLTASVRGGVRYTEYDDAASIIGLDDDDISPYVDANANWTYLPGSYAQLGVRHDRHTTDVGIIGASNPIVDATGTTVYGSVNHRITAKLIASLIGQWQHSEFEGDGSVADGLADDYILAGVNLSYQINQFLAAETGYNYDRLDSELHQVGVGRSFTRNRVYVGIRASY
ncbi:MAG: outer membrane beta-barrel protein [Verrucomicrobiota bacterium]|nr:outer membrane beta-barrel protein [Verrucomicrobiota bacterium]